MDCDGKNSGGVQVVHVVLLFGITVKEIIDSPKYPNHLYIAVTGPLHKLIRRLRVIINGNLLKMK